MENEQMWNFWLLMMESAQSSPSPFSPDSDWTMFKRSNKTKQKTQRLQAPVVVAVCLRSFWKCGGTGTVNTSTLAPKDFRSNSSWRRVGSESEGQLSLRVTVIIEQGRSPSAPKRLIKTWPSSWSLFRESLHRFTLSLCYYFKLVWMISTPTLKASGSVIIFCKRY